MTWKEFKALVEENGVKDEDVIDYIDISRDLENHISVWIEENGPDSLTPQDHRTFAVM